VVGSFARMTIEDKRRLHDVRVKHGLGLEMAPYEYQELIDLQAKEHIALQESTEVADLEFAATGWR
jgi:hypothetical protein